MEDAGFKGKENRGKRIGERIQDGGFRIQEALYYASIRK